MRPLLHTATTPGIALDGEPTIRASRPLTLNTILVREAIVLGRLREALGDHTQLDCVKKLGSWRQGGGPNTTRRWVAAYGPDEENDAIGECDKRLVTTTECLSPEEAEAALMRNVRERGMWPVVGTPAPVLGSLTAEHFEAAHGACEQDDTGDVLESQTRPVRFDQE